MKCEYCENDGYYTPNEYLIDKEWGMAGGMYGWKQKNYLSVL